MNFVANHLWQSTLFAAAAGLLTLAFRGNRASVRHALWFAASLKFLVPFAWLVTAMGQWMPPVAAPALPVVRAMPVVHAVSQPFVFAAAAPAPAPSRLPVFLLAIWLCGIVYHLFRWSRQWNSTRAAARNAKPLPLAAPIPVRSAQANLEPGVFGIFRPVLLLPEGLLEQLSPRQFEAILLHELCHVRRRDNLAAAVHMLVETVFWFHPLLWWIETRLVEERERACDEEVLRHGADAESYAEGILHVCRRYLESPLPCVSGVTGADLKKRIAGILRPSAIRELGAAKKLLLAAVAAACLAGVVVIGHAQAQSFAVASIKDDNSPPPWRIGLDTHPGGRIHFTGPLVFLLGFAYDLPFQSKRLTGIPDWGNKEALVIDAAPDPGVIPAGLSIAALQERVRPMLQALLADRFKLVIRHESQEVPVYALTVGKGGLKLQPAGIEEKDCAVDGKIDCHDLHGGISGLSGEAANLDDFAQSISDWADRPVVNRTGINTLYKIKTINFGPMIMGSAATGKNPTEGADDPDRPTIAMMLSELGLNLQPSKASLEMYVIEHVERPTKN